MIPLLLGLLGLGKSVLLFFQNKQETRAKAQSEFWTYQIAFIQATAGIETRIVRQAIVLAFAGALFSKTWGAVLVANAQALPPFGWLILAWEFFGASALSILPWYKGVAGDSNGDGIPDVPVPPAPLQPDPLTTPRAPIDGGRG